MIKLLDFSEIKKDFESYRINKDFKHDVIKDINYMQVILLKDFINNKVDTSYYTLYYKYDYSYMNELIETSLYSLCDRALIRFDRYGVVVVDTNGEYKEVKDEEELDIIYTCEKKALIELGLKSTVNLYNELKMLKQFYGITNNLIKQKLNYECVYHVYKIRCNTKYLDRGLEENLISLALDLDIFNERND